MSRFIRKRVFFSIIILSIAGLSIQGCASGSLTRIEATNELPKELQQYEVKTEEGVVPATLTDASGASVVPVSQESKPSKKKAKEKKKKAVAKGVFEYPMRRPSFDPIWLGEKLVYEITYFGMPAGDFTLEVLPFKAIKDRRVYHIRGVALSSKVFNLFYRLNDTVETFIDYDGIFSHRFHLQLDETKQTRDSLELYDSEKRETFYWNRWHHVEKEYVEKKEYAEIPPFSQDTLSALYFIRTLPLKENAVYTFPVASEGKSWEAVITVIRREMLETPFGKVQTVVVKPQTKHQGVLRNQGDSFMWMTDDDRRILVRLEAKVKIGTVVAVLKKAEKGISPKVTQANSSQVEAVASPGPTESARPLPEPKR